MTDIAVRSLNGTELPGPGTWAFDTSHSSLEFTVRHMAIGKTRGRFSTWSGSAVIAEDPTESSVAVSVEIASVDTRDAKRDGHLLSPDFFDVEAFPTMSFSSTKVEGGGTSWKITGDLTIRGVTKSVVLDLSVEGVVAKDPFGFSRVAFSGSTEVSREDFGLTWNAAMETGGVLVGKTAKIAFDVEAVLQP